MGWSAATSDDTTAFDHTFKSPKMGSNNLTPVFRPTPWSHRSFRAASLVGRENALPSSSQSPQLGEEDPGQAGWSKRGQKLGSKLSLGETGKRQSSRTAASICYKSAATVKPRLFLTPRLSRVEQEKEDPEYKMGCMKHRTRCLLHPGADSHYCDQAGRASPPALGPCPAAPVLPAASRPPPAAQRYAQAAPRTYTPLCSFLSPFSHHAGDQPVDPITSPVAPHPPSALPPPNRSFPSL